jgi:hypothetical protein
MVRQIRIYFEGDDRLRIPFGEFFLRLDRRLERLLKPIAADGDPIGKYRIGLRQHLNSSNILLLDSDEDPIRRQRVADLPRDRVFWMVEMMESWFLADTDAVKSYYNDPHFDPGFRESALPAKRQVEEIQKRDVHDGLRDATRDTRKRAYHKTKHAPEILRRIDPEKLRARAPQFQRLCDVLNGLLTDGTR